MRFSFGLMQDIKNGFNSISTIILSVISFLVRLYTIPSFYLLNYRTNLFF